MPEHELPLSIFYPGIPVYEFSFAMLFAPDAPMQLRPYNAYVKIENPTWVEHVHLQYFVRFYNGLLRRTSPTILQ